MQNYKFLIIHIWNKSANICGYLQYKYIYINIFYLDFKNNVFKVINIHTIYEILCIYDTINIKYRIYLISWYLLFTIVSVLYIKILHYRTKRHILCLPLYNNTIYKILLI